MNAKRICDEAKMDIKLRWKGVLAGDMQARLVDSLKDELRHRLPADCPVPKVSVSEEPPSRAGLEVVVEIRDADPEMQADVMSAVMDSARATIPNISGDKLPTLIVVFVPAEETREVEPASI